MLSRFVICVLALSAFTACVGEDDKVSDDSADSIPLVADHEERPSYAVRCATEEDGDCYTFVSILDIPGLPGEFFEPAGSLDCPLGDDGPTLGIHVYPGGRINEDGDPGWGELTITYDCGGVIPEDGYRISAEAWVVGDMGTVLHYVAEAEYQAE